MDLTHLFIGGGIIAALLPRIQEFAALLVGLMIERRDFHYAAGEPVAAWLASLHSLPLGPTCLETVPQRAKGRARMVFCRNNTRPGIFVYRWRLFYVRIDRRNSSGGPELFWLRFTYGRDELALAAMRHYNAILSDARGRFAIFRRSGAGSVHARQQYSNSGGAVPVGSSDKSKEQQVRCGLLSPIGGEPMQFATPAELFFPREIEEVVAEIGHSLEMEAWFTSRGLPWRRGYLFHGMPGTGKTSMACRVAFEHDMPVFVFDLASMSNREFFEAWQDAAMQTPCLVLLEDIDRVFDGTRNLAGEAGGGLTFDAILNAVSGAQPADGVFLVITANDSSKIDTALSDGKSCRPGRIDRAIEFGPMQESCRRKLANKMLDHIADVERETVVDAGEGETAAQFQERCIQVALSNASLIAPRGADSLPILRPNPNLLRRVRRSPQFKVQMPG